LAGVVEFRKLVERGQFGAAYSKAQDVLPRLSRKKRADFEQRLNELKAILRNGSDRTDGAASCGPHYSDAFKKSPS
jgi:hypothetical protein